MMHARLISRQSFILLIFVFTACGAPEDNPNQDLEVSQASQVVTAIESTVADDPYIWLEEVEGRKLLFSIVADDGIDKISEGTHERFVIDAAKFNEKVAEKGKQAATS